ncbi:MAG: diaminopimelate decarboxylase [Pirellulales bacterium]|nr:diaminopimelate decarboxylase [Pirellulales bacterium]
MPNIIPRPPLRSEIAGVSIQSLVSQFGTPTFVYDAAVIRQRIAELSAFDYVRYAQKACSNLSILDLIRREGVLVDTVSANEIRRALAAGYTVAGDPPPVVYTADIFDRESLDICVEKRLHVNCGSMDMIAQLGARLPGAGITLRINPGFGHGHSQKTNTGGKQSKHGIWHAQIPEGVELAKKYRLAVTGLHVHIGSGTDLEHLAQVCGALEKAAEAVGPSVASISVGGGLPTVYREGDAYVDLAAYFALCDAARKRLEGQFGHPLRLEIEPGRYLVAESGYLLAEIRAVKRQDDNLFYLVDAGFNNLARPILYGSYHPMSVARGEGRGERGEGRESDNAENSPLQEVVVGGPLCESGDIFTQEEGGFVRTRKLPPAQVGDILVIECAGAYGFVMGSNYNSKPLAAEVLLDDAHPRLIRRRQTFDDLVREERF